MFLVVAVAAATLVGGIVANRLAARRAREVDDFWEREHHAPTIGVSTSGTTF